MGKLYHIFSDGYGKTDRSTPQVTPIQSNAMIAGEIVIIYSFCFNIKRTTQLTAATKIQYYYSGVKGKNKGNRLSVNKSWKGPYIVAIS